MAAGRAVPSVPWACAGSARDQRDARSQAACGGRRPGPGAAAAARAGISPSRRLPMVRPRWKRSRRTGIRPRSP